MRLTSPPVDDAANEQLVEVLARALDVSRRQVRLVAGARSRYKRVRVEGASSADAAARIAAAIQRG